MVATLVCHVRQRLPYAVATLYGTLDRSSVISAVVSVRDCLAEAPTALLLDVAHLVVSSPEALVALVGVAAEAREFPAARVGLCAAPAALVALLGRVAAPGTVDLFDDVAEAKAGLDGRPAVPRLTRRLAFEVDAPAKARAATVRACADWNIPRARRLAEVVVSELVANAVVHARTPCVLTLRCVGDLLQIAVRDGDPRPFMRPVHDPDAPPTGEHGRGLLLLDAMASRWGCLPVGDGKVIWAYVPVRAQLGTAV